MPSVTKLTEVFVALGWEDEEGQEEFLCTPLSQSQKKGLIFFSVHICSCNHPVLLSGQWVVWHANGQLGCHYLDVPRDRVPPRTVPAPAWSGLLVRQQCWCWLTTSITWPGRFTRLPWEVCLQPPMGHLAGVLEPQSRSCSARPPPSLSVDLVEKPFLPYFQGVCRLRNR